MKEKLWRPEFIFLLVINVINFTGFGIITPQIPRFAVSLGATLAMAGILVSIFSFSALVGRPFASAMGDRLNKKHLLITALALNGFFTVLHAFIPGIAWLIPLRVIHGLIFSVSGTLAIALSVDYIPKSRIGEGVGFLGLGNIIGMALGPNIGIFIVDNFDFQINFIVSGLIILSSGLAVFLLKYKASEFAQEESPKRRFRLGDLVAIELLPNVLFVAMFMLCTGLINSFLVMLGYERGIVSVGIYFIINSIVAVLTRPTIGKLVDKKGSAFVILPGYIFAAIGMLIIGSAGALWHLLIAAVFVSIGIGCGLPSIQADCLKRLGSARRTVATGTYFIGLDLGMIVGPLAGGMITGVFGFQVTFYSAAILLLLGFVVYFIHWRRQRAKTSEFTD